ncbi:MAG: hypothetical protein MI975_18995 [Cytophagales bacterium]|nr:hypothetical protein [Cytophagales bacterium]
MLIQWLFIVYVHFSFMVDTTRFLEHNGSKVLTTYSIEDKFIGAYNGSKSGFLRLNRDGNGVYRYDYSELSLECPGEEIEIKWGFILDEYGEIVKLKRTYGFSYPILYNCSGANAFQGCTKRSMIDFILVYDDGTITVSSSDDWVKKDN